MEDDERWNPKNWPESFRSYLKDNNISPEIYLQEQSRFIYVLQPELFSTGEEEIKSAKLVDSCPNFYSLPGSLNIAHTKVYRSATILAIDPNSLLAVDCLGLEPGEHVLDLCCAPGAKLVLMAQRVTSSGSVTGVDISRERLGATVRMAKKYRLPKARIFCADGTRFDTPVHQIVGKDQVGCSRIYDTTPAPLWSSSPYRKQKGLLQGSYDKVLVDAQCTHDGSIKHIRKHIENDWKYYEPEHFSVEGLASLYDLQFHLLCNGFRLLREGGLLLYSTCSSSRNQNEAIIARFMHSQGKLAEILEPNGPRESLVTVGTYGLALQVRPQEHGNGGGFFICTIRKLYVLNRN